MKIAQNMEHRLQMKLNNGWNYFDIFEVPWWYFQGLPFYPSLSLSLFMLILVQFVTNLQRGINVQSLILTMNFRKLGGWNYGYRWKLHRIWNIDYRWNWMMDETIHFQSPTVIFSRFTFYPSLSLFCQFSSNLQPIFNLLSVDFPFFQSNTHDDHN